jgi:rare lipoprotein A (peptidoglycan hydrolase)
MRRAVAVMVVSAALTTSLLHPAAAAEDPRSERAALLLRIAELTDRLEDTQAAVVQAQFRQRARAKALADARRRLRDRAIAAYLYGSLATEAAEPAPGPYLAVAVRKERALLEEAANARDDADTARATAEGARARMRATGSDLAAARSQLDARIAADDARRDEEQRKADAARRAAVVRHAAERATARASGGLLPRHRQATARQIELMARYPFGPLPPDGSIPASLRRTGQTFSGLASWYGPGFDGRATASGAIYDMEGWTTASRELPLGTMLIVSRNGKHLLLLVNDRGPYVANRVLDLSHAAAVYLGVGVSPVTADVVAPV